MTQDIAHLIERLEMFEERLGMTLEGLFAFVDERGDVIVNGELYSRNDAQISHNMKVIASAYDSAGRVLATNYWWVDADSFFGFEPFSVKLEVPRMQISKIRVCPKP